MSRSTLLALAVAGLVAACDTPATAPTPGGPSADGAVLLAPESPCIVNPVMPASYPFRPEIRAFISLLNQAAAESGLSCGQINALEGKLAVKIGALVDGRFAQACQIDEVLLGQLEALVQKGDLGPIVRVFTLPPGLPASLFTDVTVGTVTWHQTSVVTVEEYITTTICAAAG